MSEIWRDIEGYEGRYQVSNTGQVRSFLPHRGRPTPRIMRLTPDRKGYPQVRLMDANTVARTHPVHRLVTAAFLGPRPAGLVTRHLDGDPTNNHISNLTYGTISENGKDTVRHGRHRSANKTHCPHGHPYDEANTYIAPNGGRICRTCRNRSARAAEAKRRAA